MNEQKEIPVKIPSPAPRFRYWATPPATLRMLVADLEPFVPKASWKAPVPEDLSVEIPAEQIFSKNVPRIPLRDLSELLPDLISPSEGVVKLPAAKLAATYRLVQHVEELPPEVLPEPEPPADPAPVIDLPAEPAETRDFDQPEPDAATAQEPSTPAPVTSTPTPEPSSPPPAPTPEPPTPKSSDAEMPAPKESSPVAEIPAATPEDQSESRVSSSKFPPKRTGSFVGLPLFRRKTPIATPPTEESFAAPSSIEVPPLRPPHIQIPYARKPDVNLPPVVSPMPQAVEHSDVPDENPEAGSEASEAPQQQPEQTVSHGQEEPERANPEEPAAIPPPAPHVPPVAASSDQLAETEIPAPIDAPAPTAGEEAAETETFQHPDETSQPMAVLQAEHFSESEPSQEIVEQEPLQALFLVEETLTVNRVIKLCCELPGINSCVLAHGSMVVASHNAPEGVDLISMSAHAADMLEAMRSSSARMGVGAVPAVTLHTEKGVISFFHRDDLTMLVFHKDRGFVPGVREKMAAVIGELTKARLTLTLGGEETAE